MNCHSVLFFSGVERWLHTLVEMKCPICNGVERWLQNWMAACFRFVQTYTCQSYRINLATHVTCKPIDNECAVPHKSVIFSIFAT